MYENWKTRASLLQRAQDPDDHSAWDEFVSIYRKSIGTVIGKSGVKFDDIDKSLKGADAQDIADELGLTLQTVYVLRSRVKSALRKEIESLRERVEFH